MSIELFYPNTKATPETIFSLPTLNKVVGELLSWQQGVGAFGKIILHGCWLESSVLQRRYHGQYGSLAAEYLKNMMQLYEATDDGLWQRHARGLVENILWLQDEQGGFRHSSAELEPAYFSRQTCPIHQGLPLRGLLTYYTWPHCDPVLKQPLKTAIDQHISWFIKRFWQVGNAFKRPLPHAGWCGVTNQDLVVINNLAAYGNIFGDWSHYETYGKPALEVYLSDIYYYPELGKFERGDAANFVERTPYYHIILEMPGSIHTHTGDERLPAVIKNIGEALFEAAFIAADGNTYLAFGMETDPDDKTIRGEWIQRPCYASPTLLLEMKHHLNQYPDRKRQRIYDALKETFCQYVYADGTIPNALGTEDPLFVAVSQNNWLDLLLSSLNDKTIKNIEPEPPLHIERHCDDLVYQSNPTAWRILRGGEVQYTGIKLDSGAITIGNELVARAPDLGFSNAEITEYVAAIAP